MKNVWDHKTSRLILCMEAVSRDNMRRRYGRY